MNLESGIRWYLVFLFSTVCHEAAHAWVAHRLGDDTAYRGGQASLDPIPHIRRSPVGMVLIPILSYVAGGWMIGWASAPYSVAWARAFPRRAAAMAMAGPLANLTLLVAASVMIFAGCGMGWFSIASHPDWGNLAIGRSGLMPFAAQMLSLVVSLNLLLCLFNLIPLPPLDGASIPLLFLTRNGAERYADFLRHPGLAMFGLVIAWKVAGPLLSGALSGYFGFLKSIAGFF